MFAREIHSEEVWKTPNNVLFFSETHSENPCASHVQRMKKFLQWMKWILKLQGAQFRTISTLKDINLAIHDSKFILPLFVM